MLDYKLLQALETVIRLASFEKAAQTLGLTQSAVSQRVKLLEQRIGLPLIVRSSPLTATEAGMLLLRHTQQVSILEQDLLNELGQESKQAQRIALAVNADSLATWFPDVMKTLFEQHNLLVELVVRDEEQTLGRLQRGEVIGCISSQSQAVQGGRCEYLGNLNYITVATPAFAQRFFATGLTNESVAQAPAVIYGRYDELHNRFLQQHFDISPGQYPHHVLSSSQGFIDVALKGIAYSLVVDAQALPYLKRGELIEVMPDKGLTQPLFWHYRTLHAQGLQQITALVHRHARQHLDQSF